MAKASLTHDRTAIKPLPPTMRVDLPETRRFRVKSKILGKALNNDQLAHERLGKPTALAVFASDALSSTAYATEEILRTLLFFGAGIGFLAFSYVVPITIALVCVLVILVFSYRQTIKAYPSAGGAYIVTKDNLGIIPAQVAGVSLLTDYILTVAVSTSAGVAALYSVVPALYAWRVPIALGFIAIIAIGNLRGVKESGRIFAVPTYAFIIAMFAMIITGLVKAVLGSGLHHVAPTDPAALKATGSVSIFLLLHAFASGGAAMTGVEAISNGVPAFKPVEWKHARETLMVMGVLLGTMFLGISWLAAKMWVVPSDSKTVIAQIAQAIYGTSPLGHVLYVFTLGATMFILVLAANTSFADFPRLASFAADDRFLPKQLTKRGHRLVFSNGIIALAIVAAIPVVIFQADVTRLIPLYAIGVFTSFTLSQAGMAKKHIKDKEQGWRVGLFVNGLGAVTTAIVTVVIGTFKFGGGAWFIMVLVPVLVVILVRLNKAYEERACRARARRPPGRHRTDPALPHGHRADREARPELGPGRPVRPCAHARRAQGGAHRHRRRRGRRAGRGVDPARPGARAARGRRVPRPPHQPMRPRGGRRGGGRRQHRGQRAHPPARVHEDLAPAPARPHGRLDRQDAGRRAPRQRDLRAVPPRQAPRAGARGADAARSDRERRPTARASRSVRSAGASGCAWSGVSGPCACSPGRAGSPPSRPRWSTTPVASPSSSWGASRSPDSGSARGSRSRARSSRAAASSP